MAAGPVVYRNGRLLLADPSSRASALVVHQGAFVYVGDEDGAAGWAGGEVVDLGGRLVTPAFVDAHVHLVQTGQVRAGIDLSRVRSRGEVLDLVAAYRRAHPQARVIVGQGWDEGEWGDPRRPERLELDRAGDGVAVYLARVDVHSAVVSTALLEHLPGIRDEVGYRDSGWLTQDAHHRSRARMEGLFTDAERRAAARSTLVSATEQGIAAVHELGGPHLGPVEDLVRIREEAAAVGIDVVTYWGELAGEASITTARRVGAAGLAGDLCVDGAIGSRTAAMIEPYLDAPGRGARYLSDDQITQHLIDCTRAGVQAGFHAIGDDAARATVTGFRRAAEVVGDEAIRRCRHRLEHLEMLDPSDAPVLARLGVVASMQPAFDAAWGGPDGLYERRLGRRRSVGMNRLGTLERAGVALAFGSDTPVTPVAGWETVRAAVRHWQPEERLSMRSALDAASRGGYWAAGDDKAGTLSVGARASFAVWDDERASHSPPDAPLELPDLAAGAPLPRCVLTSVAGRVVFDPAHLSRGSTL